jgi:hypothetical protein
VSVEARRGSGLPSGTVVLAYRSSHVPDPVPQACLGVRSPARAAGRHSVRHPPAGSLELVRHVIDRDASRILDRPSAGRLRTLVPRHAPFARGAAPRPGACAAGRRPPAVGDCAGVGPSRHLQVRCRLAGRRGCAHGHLRPERPDGRSSSSLRVSAGTATAGAQGGSEACVSRLERDSGLMEDDGRLRLPQTPAASPSRSDPLGRRSALGASGADVVNAPRGAVVEARRPEIPIVAPARVILPRNDRWVPA